VRSANAADLVLRSDPLRKHRPAFLRLVEASVIMRWLSERTNSDTTHYTPHPLLGGNSASVSGQELLDQGYFSPYPTHRATTNVMSSCCSLPLNC